MSKTLIKLVENDQRFTDLTVEPENYPAKYWVYLADGYRHEEVHVINGPTVADILEQVKQIQPCDCDDCKRGSDPRLDVVKVVL